MGGIARAAMALFCGFCCQILAVNGFAVSSVQTPCDLDRHGQIHGEARVFFGRIVKFTIVNDRVTACDTIFSKTRAAYPQLNLQGTKVAFARKDMSTANQSGDVYVHVSVMDVNSPSQSFQDLDTFYGFEFGASAQGEEYPVLIDWPAGDYIYYVKVVCLDPCGSKKDCSEIWKVKYNDPASKTKVGSYDRAYTWGMALDATKAGVTTMTQGSVCNNINFNCLPHMFPPASTPTNAGWSTPVWVGCGSYLSPSGKHHQHFYGGDHSSWRINTLDVATKTMSASVDILSSDFPAWKTDPTVSNEDVGAGPDMNWARWAVNSDKWIMGCTNLRNTQVIPPVHVGCNQVIVNWVDHKAIVTSRNYQPLTNPTACTVRSNDPGDMWVAGGPANAYEGIDGKWYDAISHTVTSIVSERLLPDRSSSSSERNSIYTLKGERIGITAVDGMSPGKTTRIHRGACIVQSEHAASRMIMVH